MTDAGYPPFTALAPARYCQGELPRQGPNVLILVVDDEPDHRKLAQRVMERADHTVLTARDALQALELLAEHEVDLVVTDQFMPHMTGLELAAKIHEEHPDVVCVVWSGVDDAQQGDVLPKNVMMLRVDGWLEQHASKAPRAPGGDDASGQP